MDFKTAMEHYQKGTASPEERRFVEEELEKSQLIAQYLDSQWESAAVPEAPPTELKQIRKTLRNRNILIVLTSLILAAALCFGILQFAIPTWESQYWGPNARTRNSHVSDLTLTLSAYAELFSPTQSILNVNATHTGFASYSLSIQQLRVRGYHSDTSYLSANLSKGKLSFCDGFWEYVPANIFVRACWPEYDMGEAFDRQTRERLSTLPDYIWVTAAVSFERDLSMEELTALQASFADGFIQWSGIRICGMEEQMYPLCGMKPYASGVVLDFINETYPDFDIKLESAGAGQLESHFQSLLQFSLDQQQAGTGLDTVNTMADSYYTRALEYVEENGVYSYGCYISGPASLFLELMDSGIASQVWIEDAWIYA